MKYILTIILSLLLFCGNIYGEEIYSNVSLDVLVALEGAVAIYVYSPVLEKKIWFASPPGKDDEMLAIAIAAIAMECQLFVTYDDKTMELISVGILGE